MCIKSPSAVWKCLSMIWKADLWFWKISFQIRGTLADNHSVHCAGYPKMVCSTEGRTTSGQNLVGRMVSSRGQKLENLKRSFQLEIRSRGLWPIIKIQGPLQLEKELQGQQTKKNVSLLKDVWHWLVKSVQLCLEGNFEWIQMFLCAKSV